MVRWALVWLVLLGAPACYQVTGPEQARLQVVSEPETARVFVDERFVGSGRILSREPKALPTGPHRVSIEAPGFFPHD